MASDGHMSKNNGKTKTLYCANIEVAEPQVIIDISEYLGCRYRYRNRVIRNKVRHFWTLNVPISIFNNNCDCFVVGRPGLYDFYINLTDKDSFIRGLFDGDGTVCEVPNNRSRLRIGFSVNSISNDIKLIIEHYAAVNGITLSEYQDKRSGKFGSWFISINRVSDVEKFFRNIYKNNPKLFLKRKYNVFVNHGFPDLVTGR